MGNWTAFFNPEPTEIPPTGIACIALLCNAPPPETGLGDSWYRALLGAGETAAAGNELVFLASGIVLGARVVVLGNGATAFAIAGVAIDCACGAEGASGRATSDFAGDVGAGGVSGATGFNGDVGAGGAGGATGLVGIIAASLGNTAATVIGFTAGGRVLAIAALALAAAAAAEAECDELVAGLDEV